jgi:tetratricopeptide (TPR) repeat protein
MALRLASFILLASATAFLLLADCTEDPITPEAANDLYMNAAWTKAAQAYEQLTRQQADNGQFWFRLANCRLMLREYEQALAACDKALACGAPEGEVRYSMARARALQGDRDAALLCLQMSAAAGFANPRQITSEVDLAPLHDQPGFKTLIEKLETPTTGLQGVDDLDQNGHTD